MRHAGLDEAQAGIKIAGRNLNDLKYIDDTRLMAETLLLEETLESPLDCRDPTSPSYRKSVLGVHWKD